METQQTADKVEIRFTVDGDDARLLLTVHAVLVQNLKLYPAEVIFDFAYLLDRLGDYLDPDEVGRLGETAKRNYYRLFPGMREKIEVQDRNAAQIVRVLSPKLTVRTAHALIRACRETGRPPWSVDDAGELHGSPGLLYGKTAEEFYDLVKTGEIRRARQIGTKSWREIAEAIESL